MQVPKKSFGINESYFVVILSFLIGFEDLSSLALYFYQSQVLNLQSDFMQMMQGIIFVPWTLKPIFGFSFDQIMKVLPKSKFLVYICCLVKAICFFVMAKYPPNTFFFYIIYFITILCGLYVSIICEYLLVLSSKKANEETEEKNENHLPIFFGFRCLGSVLGNLLGGYVYEKLSLYYNFYFTALIPIVGILIGFFYDEQTKIQTKPRTIKQEVSILGGLLCRGQVLPMVIFVILVSMTPNFDNLTKVFFLKILKFDSNTLAWFQSVGQIAYMIGLLVYSKFFIKVSPKKVFVATNLILWLVNFSFLMVIFNIIT